MLVEKHFVVGATAALATRVAGARATRVRRERREVWDAMMGCCDGNGVGRQGDWESDGADG